MNVTDSPLPHRRRRTAPRLHRLAMAATVVSACGGAPAGAQPAPPSPASDTPVYLYEVSPEHARAVTVAAQEASPFIEVSGNAAVSVSPDRVQAAFAVETRAKSAADAAAENARLMDAVIRALRASGVEGLRVETFGYALRPVYTVEGTRPPRTQVIDGYTALNNIRATAMDVNAAGTLIDAAIGAGANRVSNLSFTASDTEDAHREALSEAVRGARLQAETMARALGRVLGDPLEVRGGAQVPYPRQRGDMMFRAEAAAVDTPIEAGDLTVSANVTVRFALGGPLEGR